MVLGITFSAPEDLKKWRDDIGLSCDLLSDGDRSVAMAYGAASSPDQEKAGRIAVSIGADGRIVESYEVADAAGHASAAVASLA